MVSVLPLKEFVNIKFQEKDVEIITTKGSGPGGQHRNKVETMVVLKHKPTGIVIRSGTERSQYQNKQIAYEILEAKLKSSAEKLHQQEINQNRKQQMGSGKRAEKIRTYMLKHNIMVDHRTGNKTDLQSWLKGKW
jgi:peptide chain release factor 1